VLELPSGRESGPEVVDKSTWKSLRDRLGEVAQVFRDMGIAAKTIVLEGDPADQLIEYAKGERADLIICGTRGLGGFEAFLLGSVAYKLFIHSSVPVLVVK